MGFGGDGGQQMYDPMQPQGMGGGGMGMGQGMDAMGRKTPNVAPILRQHPQAGQMPHTVKERLAVLYEEYHVELDQGAWEILLQLSETAALAALEEVYSAMTSERGVRNVCAYFTGIARKYLDPDHAPPSRGPTGGDGRGSSGIYGEGVPADDLFSTLSPRIRQHLEQFIGQGVFNRSRFDFRAIDTLRKLRDEDAVAALEELARNDISKLRNFSAYFMGICNKFLRGPR